MKKKDNLHRDYIPIKVKDCIKSSLVRGIVLKVLFRKIDNLSFLQSILIIFGIYKGKDIYFWLPYRNVVDISDKYSIIGPNSRFPYAKCWFEVKETSEIYKQGLNDFVFKQQLLYQHANELRSTPPFLASELLALTHKKVIRVLNDYVYNRQNNNKKRVS